MRGVYIHIPFCNSICSYCDFCKLLYNPTWASLYLDCLKKEIEKYYENDVVTSIYIGGGTPSVLSNVELEKLFEIIKVFNKSDSCELTIEANINDISEDFISLIKKYKFNRLSIGVQSLNKYKCKFLNRKHTKKDVKEKIALIKNMDFENYNIDFIYGVPIENYSIFKKDLKDILSLNPTHISTYSLMIEPSTVLYINNVTPVDENLDAKMYKYICKTLQKKGYKHYEVSNFSLHGYESNHNLNYWNNNEYYGFGISSHGYVNGVRYENTKNLNKYFNDEYRKEELFISKKEEMENEVMLGLRKIDGINLKDFFDKFKVNIQDVFDLEKEVKNNDLILDKYNLKINPSKIYVMNEILVNILKDKE